MRPHRPDHRLESHVTLLFRQESSSTKNLLDGERKARSHEAQPSFHYSGERFLLREILNPGAETKRNTALLLAMINICLPAPTNIRTSRAPQKPVSSPQDVFLSCKMSRFREPAFTLPARIALQSPSDSWIVWARRGLGACNRRFRPDLI
ncbi:hypothetical protein [Bosea sp. 685]|uniref:hypothetical protein n=1 Tax=Bosea sp. 685 TaxID=3080057 RepID=UPI002892B00A|nr:hypothetical protein [Bosea sp. 685]WNJ91144.1 hypothetical protein RMR04_02215 [Bosea sp. 685]